MSSKCVFCEIANDDPRGQVLRDYGRTVVFEPLGPVAPGHLLVVPKLHVTDAADKPGVTAEAYGVAAREAGAYEAFNLITSKGRPATQSVFHLHIHVVPRTENDGLALPWYSGKSRRTA